MWLCNQKNQVYQEICMSPFSIFKPTDWQCIMSCLSKVFSCKVILVRMPLLFSQKNYHSCEYNSFLTLYLKNIVSKKSPLRLIPLITCIHCFRRPPSNKRGSKHIEKQHGHDYPCAKKTSLSVGRCCHGLHVKELEVQLISTLIVKVYALMLCPTECIH